MPLPILPAVGQSMMRLGLQPQPAIAEKAAQLHSTMQVRHGIMLVGAASSGKTTALRVLQQALDHTYNDWASGNHIENPAIAFALASAVARSGPGAPLPGRSVLRQAVLAATNGKGLHVPDTTMEPLEDGSYPTREIVPSPPPELPVDAFSLSPRAVSLEQLYGKHDPTSQEWTDGLLAAIFRRAATAADKEARRKWLVLDGTVDSAWMENLNSVLDDSKILCLSSGEVLPLHNRMQLVFETESLAAASPATVSRCAMVYFEKWRVGWRPVVASWLDQLPPVLAHPENAAVLLELFQWLFDPAVRLVLTGSAGRRDAGSSSQDDFDDEV